MKISKTLKQLNRYFFLVCVVMTNNLYASQSDHVLKTVNLTVASDNETGVISRIEINQLVKGITGGNSILSGGMFSLDWLTQPELESQRIIKSNKEKSILETNYVNHGLQIVRLVSRGASPYSLSIRYKIINASNSIIDVASLMSPTIHFANGFEGITDERGGYGSWVYSYIDLFVSDSKRTLRIDADELNTISDLKHDQWIGWVNRHNIIAVKMLSDFGLVVDKDESLSEVSNDVALTPASLALTFTDPKKIFLKQLVPNELIEIEFEIVIAPKQWEVLSISSPPLDGAILLNLWDWFRSICFVVWQLLSLLYDFSGSWGMAIILMALVVRIAITPITRISLKYQEIATEQQERLRPLIKELKNTYSSIKLSEQLVALYDREKYDHFAPFKGMLSLFVQIPILIALFNVVGEAPELKNVPFLWFNDLSLADRLVYLGFNIPFFGAYLNVLPFMMAGITVVSTYFAMRSSGRDLPATSLFGMAGLFFILFYSFPSALVLYWLSSTLFQFMQQIIEEKYKRE